MEPPDELVPAAPLRPLVRTADSPFSHECRACGRCCRDKRIVVNPYEVARLAANRGLTTTELVERYTESGVALQVDEGGACVFLTETGCAVHPDRPLACRLYPLGAVTLQDGREIYMEMEPDPGCQAEVGENGSVAQYLETQAVAPYRRAARAYRVALTRLIEMLADEGGPDVAGDDLTNARVAGAAAEVLDLSRAMALARARGFEVPADLEGRAVLHAELIATGAIR